jgi:hypothetical protein
MRSFFEAERAIRLAHAIEPFNPMWMEESCARELRRDEEVSDHVNIPLASGESNYGLYEFKELIERPGSRFRTARHLLLRRRTHAEEDRRHGEAQYIMVAPHNPMSRWRQQSTYTSRLRPQTSTFSNTTRPIPARGRTSSKNR